MGSAARRWFGQKQEKIRAKGPTRKESYLVSVINQKGGTGKTTTTINLGAALAYLGFSTLMVDLDPQGHTTIGLGIDPDSFLESMAEVMSVPQKPVSDITLITYVPDLYLAPAHPPGGLAFSLYCPAGGCLGTPFSGASPFLALSAGTSSHR
jgi:Mrp family chromosome partitioning ATPase